MQKDILLPGDSTVVELIYNTKTTKGKTTKSATVLTNDTTELKLAIGFTVNVIPSPDTTSMVRCTPDNLQFAKGGASQQIAKIKNNGTSSVQITQVFAPNDGIDIMMRSTHIAPGAEGAIVFSWTGGTPKQGIKHIATFATTDPTIPIFSIPYVVEGTEPFPPEHPEKPAAPAQTTTINKPGESGHIHNKPDLKSPIQDQAKTMTKPDSTGKK